MNIPEWATHVAVDEDGEICVFDRAPVFLEPDSHACGLWALPDTACGLVKIIVHSESTNAPVLPVKVARLLCVEIPHVRVDSEGREP